MRVCTIDIGANSVRGLVADLDERGRIAVAHREGQITRLGQQLSRTGVLHEFAIERTAKAVSEIVEKARSLGTERFKIAAMSAARDARNSHELIDRIRQLTSLQAEIITGLEEAKYICEGALNNLEIKSNSVLMADIGGGSTELIFAPREGEPVFRSVGLGAVHLTSAFFRYDPPMGKELSRSLEHARSLFRKTFAELPSGAEELIGLGGTITTIPPMLMEMEKYDPERVHNYVVPREEVEWTLHRLAMLPLWDRTMVKGLEVARADIIIGGLVIVKALLEVTAFESIRVSDRGILFGLALSLQSAIE